MLKYQCALYLILTKIYSIIPINLYPLKNIRKPCNFLISSGDIEMNPGNEWVNLYWEILPTLHKKMKFSIKDFFNKCDQLRRKLRIWSHLLMKFLMENFIFVQFYVNRTWNLSNDKGKYFKLCLKLTHLRFTCWRTTMEASKQCLKSLQKVTLKTLFTNCSGVSMIAFELVNDSWINSSSKGFNSLKYY